MDVWTVNHENRNLIQGFTSSFKITFCIYSETCIKKQIYILLKKSNEYKLIHCTPVFYYHDSD